MCNEQCFVKTMWILCRHWIPSIPCYLIKKREKSDSSSCSFLKISLTRGYIQVIITKRSARAEAWNRPGELSERFKVQSWKGCVVERLPRVRISYSPPVETTPLFKGVFCPETEQDPDPVLCPDSYRGPVLYACTLPKNLGSYTGWLTIEIPDPSSDYASVFRQLRFICQFHDPLYNSGNQKDQNQCQDTCQKLNQKKNSENRSQYHPFRCW